MVGAWILLLVSMVELDMGMFKQSNTTPTYYTATSTLVTVTAQLLHFQTPAGAHPPN